MKTFFPKGFYVYAYLRKDGSPYYIGKGSKSRAFKSGGRPVGTPQDQTCIAILEEGLDETVAFELEREKIRHFGRIDLGTGVLHNRSDGGEGPAGAIRSEVTRKKISEAKLGTKCALGAVRSESFRHNLSKIKTGNQYGLGKKRTPEAKVRIAEANSTRIYRVFPTSGSPFIVTNMSKFARETGLNQGNLVQVARGTRKHCGGYRVEYVS